MTVSRYRRTVLWRLCLLVLAAAWQHPRPALAGQAPDPFETIEVGADYASVVFENRFHDFWKPGAGFGIRADTPFYAGDLRLGVRYLFNRGRRSEYPDFGAAYLHLGWSWPVVFAGRFTLAPGAALGANIMSFDTEDGAGLRHETEAAAELCARFGVRAGARWTVNLTAGWQTMFTHRRIEQTWVQAGVSRRFDTPGWLRGFLE